MERIKQFDINLKKMENYNFVISKFLMYLFLILGCLWMIVPFEKKETFLWTTSYYLLFMGIYFYLRPYLYIGRTPVFYVLNWMPIEENEIFKVRREYLNRIMLKITVISFLLQQIGAVLNHSWGIWNVVYPFVMAGIVWLSGIIFIKLAMKVFWNEPVS